MKVAVILAAEQPTAALSLQQQVEQLLDQNVPAISFAEIRPLDISRLESVLRARRCAFVLMSADRSVLPNVAGGQLVDLFECPLVLVR
ncbi:MAG: hypothetical protein R3E68_22260 [Burkholderiaceae bacterium]